MTEPCVMTGQLDTLLERLGGIRDSLDTQTREMRAGLGRAEAGCGQTIRENLDIIKQTGERNALRYVTTQKSIDTLKKSSRDARQLAGAYRMSRGGAPSLDIVKGGEA